MSNKIPISDRIKFILEQKQVSMAELAGSEVQRVRISRQLNGHSGLTLPVVEMVLNRFPEISAEWLLRGEGQMDKSNHLAPHVHVTGGGSAFINEHGVNIGTQKSDPIIIPSKDELENLMRSPEGFFSIRTIFDAKDDAIAQRDELIRTLRQQISELSRDKETLRSLLNSVTSPSISADLPRQPRPRKPRNSPSSTSPTSQSTPSKSTTATPSPSSIQPSTPSPSTPSSSSTPPSTPSPSTPSPS